MFRACIAVVDASRARLFTYVRSVDVEGVSEQLTEERDLVNLARRQRPSERFSDSRPGSSRTGNLQYAFDDHRDANLAELDTEFSRVITGELAELLRSARADRLIVCASPRMLGELRDSRRELPGVAIDEMPRDLVKLSVDELRDQLASYGLLPRRPPRMPA